MYFTRELVDGCWFLVLGYWFLVLGCWLFVREADEFRQAVEFRQLIKKWPPRTNNREPRTNNE